MWWQLFFVALALLNTPPELVAIDADLVGFTAEINSLQVDYVVANGVFYQMLPTHADIPIAGAPVAWDNLYSHPTDIELIALAFLGYVPEKDYRLSIDVYEADMGQGYVLQVQTDVAGQTWQRSINVGSETWREKPWFVLSP